MSTLHSTCCQRCASKGTFSCRWWEAFLEQTAHFTRTVVFPDVLSPEKCREMSLDTLAILRKIFTAEKMYGGFRLYIGGALKEEPWLRQHVFLHPPEEGEQVMQWAERVFEDKKFCIAVNYGERFSDPLSRYLGLCLKPLLERIGIPLDGMEIDILMGNYGYTPFGIHHDRRGENVIHFHLGPGAKIMYNWEEEEFLQLPNAGQNCMDIEPFLPYSTPYPFKAGDLYYMPWNKYHIGYTGELSIGVTVWFNHPTRQSLFRKLDAQLRRHINLDDGTLTAPEKDIRSLESFGEIAALLPSAPGFAGITFTDLLRNEYEERMTAIRSNAGWGTARLADNAGSHLQEEGLKGKLVCSVPPFRITYRVLEQQGKIRLFIRGAGVDVENDPAVIPLVEKINAGGIWQADALGETGAGWRLLHLLLSKGGIALCEQ